MPAEGSTMANPSPTSLNDLDPQALANAQNLWNRFVKVGEITVIVIACVLLVMAATLV